MFLRNNSPFARNYSLIPYSCTHCKKGFLPPRSPWPIRQDRLRTRRLFNEGLCALSVLCGEFLQGVHSFLFRFFFGGRNILINSSGPLAPKRLVAYRQLPIANCQQGVKSSCWTIIRLTATFAVRTGNLLSPELVLSPSGSPLAPLAPLAPVPLPCGPFVPFVLNK